MNGERLQLKLLNNELDKVKCNGHSSKFLCAQMEFLKKN